MSQKIQIRRDTKANWESVDPVLAAGEPCFELETLKLKIGDGRVWSQTPYQQETVDLSQYVPYQNSRSLTINSGADIKLVSTSREFSANLTVGVNSSSLTNASGAGIKAQSGVVKLFNRIDEPHLEVKVGGELCYGQGSGGFCCTVGSPIRTESAFTANLYTADSYITKGYADTAYLSTGGGLYVPKVSTSPEAIQSVDELSLKSVTGDGFAHYAVNVTPADIKFVANDAQVFTFGPDYFDFTAGGGNFYLSNNQFRFTDVNGNGFAYNEQHGLTQTGMLGSPVDLTYATRGYVDGLIATLQQQITDLEHRIATLETA